MAEKIDLVQISKTHDWGRGNELPICKKCGLSPIGAHIWGDDAWTAHAIKCGEELSPEGLEEEEDRR